MMIGLDITVNPLQNAQIKLVVMLIHLESSVRQLKVLFYADQLTFQPHKQQSSPNAKQTLSQNHPKGSYQTLYSSFNPSGGN